MQHNSKDAMQLGELQKEYEQCCARMYRKMNHFIKDGMTADLHNKIVSAMERLDKDLSDLYNQDFS